MVFIRLQYCACRTLAKRDESRSRRNVLQMSTAVRRGSRFKFDGLRWMRSHQSKNKLWRWYAGELENAVSRSSHLQDMFSTASMHFSFCFYSMWWSFLSGSKSTRVSLRGRTLDGMASQENLQNRAAAEQRRMWKKKRIDCLHNTGILQMCVWCLWQAYR